jgi:uncharacterized protein (TIGR00269 family)
MKCKKCGEKAVINMPQHKLALCKEHYLEWVPEQTQRFIQKYHMFGPEDRILVAVSGGKDSLSLWDILWRLGYKCDGLYICLGIDGGVNYSAESQRLAEKFAQERGLLLRVYDVAGEHGQTIPEINSHTSRGQNKPCSVCGMVKRQVMNRVAREEDYNVLVTGHNLDDEAAVLFGNTLTWAVGYLARQGPVLEANTLGLARKAKPLCRFYEREMAAYALLSGIEYIYDECPFAVGAKSIYYKEILNKMEADRPGIKLTFYLSFLEARKTGAFARPANDEREEMHTCPTCGQPTTSPGECTFCKMMARIKTA